MMYLKTGSVRILRLKLHLQIHALLEFRIAS